MSVVLSSPAVGGQQGAPGEAEAADGQRPPQTEAHRRGQAGHRRGVGERGRRQVHHRR